MSELEIRRLRDRVEELEETVRQMRELLAPPLVLPPAWHASPGLGRFISALMARSPGFVTAEALVVASAYDQSRDFASTKLCQVYASKARRLFERHVPGAKVENGWALGYRITPGDVAQVRQAIARDIDLPRAARLAA